MQSRAIGKLARAMISGTACLCWLQAVAGTADFEPLYGALLARYWRPPVTVNGIRTTVFDYGQMATDARAAGSLFRRTVAALEQSDPSELQTTNARKAFWINVYNFGAIKLIVEHYPVESIRSLKISLLKYPWSKDAVRIQGRARSLREIEKDILLELFGDPRIVFGVSCAAVSCPDRTAEPFTGAGLDEQLDAMIRDFFSNPTKGLILDRKSRVLTLAWILEKDSELFADRKGGILGFVLPYLDQDLRQWLKANPVEIRYFDHDWTLNDLALANSR